MPIKSSNYLVFVDESGDHYLNKYPKDYPMFVLAFVIISKDEYCDHLLPRFSRLKLKYFPDVSTIFHEREIRKAEKRFAFLTNTEQRNSFQTDLSALIAETDYKVVAIVINKEEKTGQNLLTDNLYELSVRYGLAKIEDFLKSKNDFNYTTLTFESRAYSIDGYRQADEQLYNYFKETAHENFGIEIHIKSAGGLGLQFADMIARPIGIHLLRPEQENRAWEIIKGKIYKDGLIVLPKK
jgi:hypothetical protein